MLPKLGLSLEENINYRKSKQPLKSQDQEVW